MSIDARNDTEITLSFETTATGAFEVAFGDVSLERLTVESTDDDDDDDDDDGEPVEGDDDGVDDDTPEPDEGSSLLWLGLLVFLGFVLLVALWAWKQENVRS